MAKLHEYQGKQILQKFDIPIPKGKLYTNVSDIKGPEEWFEGEVVIKGQAWVTGRAGKGLIKFAATRDEAARAAEDMLGKEVGSHAIEHVLIEEKLLIEREFYAGLIIDDVTQSPVVIFSAIGGSGVEQISVEHPEAVAKTVVNIQTGLKEYQARELLRQTGIRGKLQTQLADMLVSLYQAARKYHARAAEINPIVLLSDGRLAAADCRITVDDNAVYLFPELGIEVAREFDRPPTQLEKIAWNVEKNDYRGTFFFIQMEQGFEKGAGYIGFHGAGGGGSMMSMDAVMNQGF
ncbi:MAG: ATP-grasp domain-containing protein, partial [Anaerolineaceae bacterium]